MTYIKYYKIVNDLIQIHGDDYMEKNFFNTKKKKKKKKK